jgi:hypothetical protein
VVQIKKGKLTFPAPYWEHVSEGAKDFISRVHEWGRLCVERRGGAEGLVQRGRVAESGWML